MTSILSFIGSLLVTRAHAAGVRLTDFGWDCTGFIKCGTSQDAITDISLRVITGVRNLIIALAILIFLYGALLMIISRGEEQKEAGKKAILYACFGVVLAILAHVIGLFVCGYVYLLGSGNPGMCSALLP